MKFEELREIKDSLPPGSMQSIADQLHLNVETVRNYFGGANYREGEPQQVHFEKGVNGGYVRLENTEIFEAAKSILSRKTEA